MWSIQVIYGTQNCITMPETFLKVFVIMSRNCIGHFSSVLVLKSFSLFDWLVADDKGTPAPASPVMSALDQQNEKTARNVFEQQTEKSEPDLENGNSDFEAEHAEKKTVVLKRSHLSRWALITFKMINRVKKVPLTYASVAGLIYSLFAFK